MLVNQRALNLKLVLDGDIPVFLEIDAERQGREAASHHDGGRECWKTLESRVYWELRSMLTEGDMIIDDIENGKGRDAWNRMVNGDVNVEIRLQTVEDRLNAAVCKNQLDFPRFNGEMLQIKR